MATCMHCFFVLALSLLFEYYCCFSFVFTLLLILRKCISHLFISCVYFSWLLSGSWLCRCFLLLFLLVKCISFLSHFSLLFSLAHDGKHIFLVLIFSCMASIFTIAIQVAVWLVQYCLCYFFWLEPLFLGRRPAIHLFGSSCRTIRPPVSVLHFLLSLSIFVYFLVTFPKTSNAFP